MGKWHLRGWETSICHGLTCSVYYHSLMKKGPWAVHLTLIRLKMGSGPKSILCIMVQIVHDIAG